MKTTKNKKKIIDTKIVDGKVETDYGPSSIDILSGVAVENKFDYKTEEEYENYLNELGRADLFSHAVKHSILPVDDRDRTIKRLLSAFRQYKGQSTPIIKSRIAPSVSKEALKILAEGR